MWGALSSEPVQALGTGGFVWIRGPFAGLDDAWNTARAFVDAVAAGDVPLTVLGDFVLPPLDGPPSRDFQTLHFDFGLPLIPVVPADVARFTALHISVDVSPSDAVTRLVPLRGVLAEHRWPDRDELVRRFAAYGNSHGARDDDAGYVEGSLARIIEAALAQTPVLPSVKAQPGFRCGEEFATLADETALFVQREMRPDVVAIEVCLQPGELLIFDNVALAHGRRGGRRPGELNQRVFGHPALSVHQQVELRDRMLTSFAA
jgi:hypothetical protein